VNRAGSEEVGEAANLYESCLEWGISVRMVRTAEGVAPAFAATEAAVAKMPQPELNSDGADEVVP
jgi:hypothetical protein